MLNDVPEVLCETGVALLCGSRVTTSFSLLRLCALAVLMPARALLFFPSHIKEVAP